MAAIVALIGGWRATAFLAIALSALTFAGAQTLRLDDARADLATIKSDADTARAKAEHDARLAEARLANAASNADAQYVKGLADAQSASDALAAALRAGDVRLRAPWRCETAAVLPASSDDQRRADDAARERAESAARIVGAARACDAQVTALQTYIRDAQRAVNGEGVQ